MMREVDWGRTQAIAWNGRTFTCRYAVLVRDCPPPVNGESYGIRITLEETGETAQVRDLTLCPERIRTLADRLVRGGVTPCTLADVVEDWLL